MKWTLTGVLQISAERLIQVAADTARLHVLVAVEFPAQELAKRLKRLGLGEQVWLDVPKYGDELAGPVRASPKERRKEQQHALNEPCHTTLLTLCCCLRRHRI